MGEHIKKPTTSGSASWVRRIVVILLLIFIVIQFFQPLKNNNDMSLADDISTILPVGDSVQKILSKACYDCHSNNTDYPWYSNIQPVAWWLGDHIKVGKAHLNFNEFAAILPRNGRTTLQRQLKKLEEIKETMEDGEMPLKSYLIMHDEARLTDSEKKTIFDWVESSKLLLENAVEK